MALHMEWQKSARRFGEAIIPLLLCCGILIWTRIDTVIERRSGYDRRSASPLR